MSGLRPTYVRVAMIAGEELGMLRMTRVPFPGHFLRDINSNLNCHRICGRRADLRDRGGHAKGSPVVPVHWHRYFGMASRAPGEL